ncbi:aminopeptidase [Desnuesiella massiliensis]|uniref:aminopeptidase n=1 Tax=Desnuesiella massiliensis TaxID=1650662 RepID=UPI0006E1913E|nr:aminopeptidase [Desnuesiella massiliensis]
MNFTEIIPNMVSGFEIKGGSIVLLNFLGENEDLAILDKFALEIAKVGGVPIRWQQSRELIKTYFTEVSQEYLDFPDKYFGVFKLADVVIDIFMYGPAPHKDFPKDKFPLYGAYMRKLFGALTEGKDLFIQVRVPTEENAMAEDIDYEIYKEAMYNALTIDFKKLKEECTDLINKLKSKNKVTIYSEDDKVLTFNLENRSWHKDDGTGDIPCGEVFIAPVEESAEGEISIPQVIFQRRRLTNVLLEFKAGKLIGCSSKELMEFINQFPGDKDMIAEFGIGLNENIKGLIGCTVIDEKCKGTAHIAIGMNNMFGGKNSSQLHMDFIFTPIKIELDNEILMDGAKIVL